MPQIIKFILIINKLFCHNVKVYNKVKIIGIKLNKFVYVIIPSAAVINKKTDNIIFDCLSYILKTIERTKHIKFVIAAVVPFNNKYSKI